MALKGKFKRNNTNFKAIKSVLSHLRCSKPFKNFLDFPDAASSRSLAPDSNKRKSRADWIASMALRNTIVAKIGHKQRQLDHLM